MARRERGIAARIHVGVRGGAGDPAELGELARVGVEHERTGVREPHLEDPALPLHLADRVGELGRGQRRARWVVVEEVGVQVERVDRVELEHVHQIDPHELVAAHPDRPVHVVESDRVDGVHLVCAVEVRVEPVHDHHHLVRLGPRRLGVDDEGSVETAVDVGGERERVAVVEVKPERGGVELVGEARAGLDEPPGSTTGNAVHVGGMDAVEMHRVGVAGGVGEPDAQAVALGGAERGTRDAAVVGPREVRDARGDLDLLLLRHDLPCPEGAAAGEARDGSGVEVGEDGVGVEAVDGGVDVAACAGVQGPVGVLLRELLGGRLCGRVAARGSGHDRERPGAGGGAQQASPGELRAVE